MTNADVLWWILQSKNIKNSIKVFIADNVGKEGAKTLINIFKLKAKTSQKHLFASLARIWRERAKWKKATSNINKILWQAFLND